MPLEAATSLMRQSVVPACWFSATTGLTAEVVARWPPVAESGAGPGWRTAAPMYPAPMRTARHTTAARRPFRTRAEFVILPSASAAIEGSSLQEPTWSAPGSAEAQQGLSHREVRNEIREIHGKSPGTSARLPQPEGQIVPKVWIPHFWRKHR